MKKSKHKCSKCGKPKVIVMESGYGALCRECSLDPEVRREYKIFALSDVCACGHSLAEHRDEDEPARLSPHLLPARDCKVAGCGCSQFSFATSETQ
jgi:hypothetical protein